MMIPITGLIVAPSEINWIEQPRYELGGHSLYDLFESDERVRATRKNLFDGTTSVIGSYLRSDNGELISYDDYVVSEYIKIQSEINYTFNFKKDTATAGIGFYDYNKIFISGFSFGQIDNIDDSSTFLTPINSYYVRISIFTTETPLYTFQLELGTVATAYEIYRGSEMVLAETLTYTGWDWIHFTGLEYFGLEYMDYDDLNDFYRLYISYKDY